VQHGGSVAGTCDRNSEYNLVGQTRNQTRSELIIRDAVFSYRSAEGAPLFVIVLMVVTHQY
jgi:hypothetical protein